APAADPGTQRARRLPCLESAGWWHRSGLARTASGFGSLAYLAGRITKQILISCERQHTRSKSRAKTAGVFPGCLKRVYPRLRHAMAAPLLRRGALPVRVYSGWIPALRSSVTRCTASGTRSALAELETADRGEDKPPRKQPQHERHDLDAEAGQHGALVGHQPAIAGQRDVGCGNVEHR